MADSQANSPTGSQTGSNIAQPPRSASRAHNRVQFQDQLSEEYTIDTPENVSFGYEVAGIGSRFVAALIDHLILGVLLVGLNVVVIVALGWLGSTLPSVDSSVSSPEEDWIGALIIAIYALLNFAIWWGYFMLFEWFWHGQTIGKRTSHIRVVKLDGSPVSFVPVAVRNLVRIVDFLPGGYGVGVITMLCNRHARRLGDFAAGTLVIKDQGELTLAALMASVPKRAPTTMRTELPTESTWATPATLSSDTPSSNPPSSSTASAPAATDDIDQDWRAVRRLTAADYELVQETLARYRSKQLDSALLGRVATAIATKVERTPSSQVDGASRPSAADHAAFLEAVAAAYGRWVR